MDYLRRLSAGKTGAEATRALQRHFTNDVYRALQSNAAARDQREHQMSEEDTRA